jgi:hypothetical protein
MEDLSLIYEDVDIKIWADEIRHIKIRELRAIINRKRNLLGFFKTRSKGNDSSSIMINRLKKNAYNKYFEDIERLTGKVKILEEQ